MKGSYSGQAIVCRRCELEAPSEAELAKYLDAYVETLPEQTRVGSETYKRRLRLCQGCERRVGLLCAECGCYVQARAAKRAQRCPKPGGAIWEGEE